MAPEGTYTAKLSIDYASKYQPVSAESRELRARHHPAHGHYRPGPGPIHPHREWSPGPRDPHDQRELGTRAHGLLVPGCPGSGRRIGEELERTVAQHHRDLGRLVDERRIRHPGNHLPGHRHGAGRIRQLRPAEGRHSRGGPAAEGACRRCSAAGTSAAPSARSPASSPSPRRALGFSPNGDKVADTITLLLGYGQPSAVVSWKVTISTPGAGTQKTYSGDGSNLPASIVWDGKSDAGAMSPEGVYTATLAVDYGTAFSPGTATSQSFVLDLDPADWDDLSVLRALLAHRVFRHHLVEAHGQLETRENRQLDHGHL